MEKRGGVEQRTPMARLDEFQLVLTDQSVGSFQTGANALRRLVGEFDRRLKNFNGEIRMRFGR